jgi:hypothetical protein
MRWSSPHRLLAVFVVVGVLGTLGGACTAPGAPSTSSQVEAVLFRGPLAGIGYSALFAAAVAALEKFLAGSAVSG